MSEGLVLSGGGATGAYEVGVLKALLTGRSPVTEHKPLDLGSIAATSIGTFNASVLLSNYDGQAWDGAVAALESTWVDKVSALGAISPNGVFRYRPDFIEWLNVSTWMSPLQPARELANDASFLARDWAARVTGLVSGSGGLAHRFAELFDVSTFITPEPTEQLVHSSLVPGRIRHSPVQLTVTTTQWETGDLFLFTNVDFTDDGADAIVRASGAIPGFFPPVPINGRLYVDGGVVLNTPLKPVIDAGAEVLHVIYLEPLLGAIPLRRIGSTIDTIGRLFVASFAATMRRDLDVAKKKNLEVAARRKREAEAKTTREAAAARGQDSHREITIHIYHPHKDTGGALGMLDFERGRIAALVERGYRDAVEHDCVSAGCLNTGKHHGTTG